MQRKSWIRRVAQRSGVIYAVREWRKNEVRRKFIKQVLPVGGVGAELGVFKGYFTRCLLDCARPQKLHLVDPWYRMAGEWPWAGGNKCTVEGLVDVLRAYKRELKSGQVEIHIGGDLEVLSAFPDQHFDWVYVDSSHEYAHTCAELELIERKMKPTGTIAGDDWREDPTHRHHGVCRAVKELIARSAYRLVYASNEDNQWAIRR